MELLCRLVLVLSIVFLETSSTLTRNSTQPVLPQLPRPLSFGEDESDASPSDVFMMNAHHHLTRDGAATALEQKRNRSKEIRENSIKSSISAFFNRSVDQLLTPASSGSSRERHRPEVGQKKKNTTGYNDSRRKKHSKTEERKYKIVSFGEKVSNVSDDRVVQFSLSEAASRRTPDRILSVTEATVSVLFRRNTTATQRTPVGPLSLFKGHQQQRRHTISVYVLSTPKPLDGGEAGGGAMSDPVAYLTVGPRKTRWLKLLLPTSVAQTAIDSEDKLLRLLITCDTCRDGDEVVILDEPMPTSSTPFHRPVTRSLIAPSKKKKGRRMGDEHKQTSKAVVGSSRTYLVVHTKTKPKPVAMTTTMTTEVTTSDTKTTKRNNSCRKARGC